MTATVQQRHAVFEALGRDLSFGLADMPDGANTDGRDESEDTRPVQLRTANKEGTTASLPRVGEFSLVQKRVSI